MRAKTAVAITVAGLLITPALAQLAEMDSTPVMTEEEEQIPPPREVIPLPVPPHEPDPVTDPSPAFLPEGDPPLDPEASATPEQTGEAPDPGDQETGRDDGSA